MIIMKVLLVNGSTNPKGNTALALAEVARTLQAEGIETELFQIPGTPVRDCIGCGGCRNPEQVGCVFGEDCVNQLIAKAAEADGFVFGTPVYYAHPSGRILSVLDRAFYAGKDAFCYKPGAAVAVARRSGTVASFDVLNKYFTINQMPVVSSTYWNNAFGASNGEAAMDAEGLQTMRNLAHQMAWLLRCIALGKEQGILPHTETGARTNFIR
jgi:multimeric flavodoxin WrbA